MDKDKVLELLIKNGYIIHPVFGFYFKDLTFDTYFYVKDSAVTIGRIKWKNIDIRENKTISFKSFNPSNFGLKTR